MIENTDSGGIIKLYNLLCTVGSHKIDLCKVSSSSSNPPQVIVSKSPQNGAGFRTDLALKQVPIAMW